MATFTTEEGTFRECVDCHKILPLEEFPFLNKQKNKRLYRCPPCKRAREKSYNEMIAKEMAENPKHPKHGTVAGYRYGCRCEVCKHAGYRHRQKYRHNRDIA